MDVKLRKPKSPGKPPVGRVAKRMPAQREVAHPLLGLRRDINALFDDVFGGFALHPFGRDPFDIEPFHRLSEGLAGFGTLSPKVDIDETEREFALTAELPGLTEADIDVTLSDAVLTISGEKREEKVEREKNVHLSERRYGSFRRTFRIPEGVDAEKVSAKFDNGVLRISLPKVAKATRTARRIKVGTS